MRQADGFHIATCAMGHLQGGNQIEIMCRAMEDMRNKALKEEI